MLTNFGKFCRKLRIDKGILLSDMAKELGVSSAFLSKVENGKAKPPVEWNEEIGEKYCLNEVEAEKLNRYIKTARSSVLKLNNYSDDQKDVMLSFARKLERMSEGDLNKMKEILNSKE